MCDALCHKCPAETRKQLVTCWDNTIFARITIARTITTATTTMAMLLPPPPSRSLKNMMLSHNNEADH